MRFSRQYVIRSRRRQDAKPYGVGKEHTPCWRATCPRVENQQPEPQYYPERVGGDRLDPRFRICRHRDRR